MKSDKARSNSGLEDERFDMLMQQLLDWTEAARGLDEQGHFPDELLDDLRDLTDEFKEYLDDDDSSKRHAVLEYFASAEMIKVMQQHPSMREFLESAWGPDFSKAIDENLHAFEG